MKKIFAQNFFIYLILFLLFNIGTQISLLTRYNVSVSEFYLPTSLAIVSIYWFGPKFTLPVLYFNAVIMSYFWGNPVEQWYLWFVYALPETIYPLLSWYFFKVIFQGKFWLPDIHHTIVFLIFGIFIPGVIEILLLQGMLVWMGSHPVETFWNQYLSNLMSEFVTTFFITLPALFYFRPIPNRYLQYSNHSEIPEAPKFQFAQLKELLIVFAVLLALVFVIDFRDFWYIFGFFSLYVAVRMGFGPALITNFYILTIIYVLPKVFDNFGKGTLGDYNEVREMFLGANLLFVFAIITGRVISDVSVAKAELEKRNIELEQTNQELDRFVYSVSHDLSSPLKSILGLVNVSRLTHEYDKHQLYLNKIESSVLKLDAFIAEVLDYSRIKRLQVQAEKINLKDLLNEIIENHKYTDDSKKIDFQFKLQAVHVWQDKLRLKIILNNLLSNAIKFQQNHPDHKPFIKISSFKKKKQVHIICEDNGQGIRSEFHDKIFQMFFRGSERSGSGLGLYIAQEAASRTHAKITFISEYGKGTTFTIIMKNLKDDQVEE